MNLPKNLNVEMLLESAQTDGTTGFCVKCGEEQGGVEPDARRRRCESCGEMAVYGAEQLLIMVCPM